MSWQTELGGGARWREGQLPPGGHKGSEEKGLGAGGISGHQTAEWGGPARPGLAQPRPEHGPSQGGVSGSSPRGCGTIIAGDSGHRGAWLGGQEELRGQLRPARVITGQCRELPRCPHSTPSPQPPLPAQPPSRALSLEGAGAGGRPPSLPGASSEPLGRWWWITSPVASSQVKKLTLELTSRPRRTSDSGLHRASGAELSGMSENWRFSGDKSLQIKPF